VIDESDSQNEKHCDSKMATDLGNSIDSIAECENPSDSIRVNHDFDSNEIDESDRLNENDDERRTSI
jgi:hypothetical protein